MKELTKSSVGQIIVNNDNPEWGEWKIVENREHEGFVCLQHVERGVSHSRLLFVNEFHFWSVVKVV